MNEGVFVHCDDLAASAGVNESMLAFHAANECDSFSVIGNGYGFQDLQKRLTALQGGRRLSLWVHLNLSEGLPASSATEVPLLLDGEGRLHWSFRQVLTRLALLKGREREALLTQIECEWRAQVLRVTSLSRESWIKVVGIDGHQHVHVVPALFKIAERLRTEAELPFIRIPRERPYLASKADVFRPIWWIGLAKVAVANACLRRCSTTTLGPLFVGLTYSGRMTSRAALTGVAVQRRRAQGDGRVQVLFHPCSCAPSEVDFWTGTSLAHWYDNRNRVLEGLELSSYIREIQNASSHRRMGRKTT